MSRSASQTLTAKIPEFQQKKEVLYQGEKAIVELVLNFVDEFDYLLKVSDNFYIPVMESEIENIMNENQIKMLKRVVILAWNDPNVPTEIYSQLIDLLETAMSSEDFVLFVETHCLDH